MSDTNHDVQQQPNHIISEQDLGIFEHQVSGHGSAEKGLLKHKSGTILKPTQPEPKRTREINFYKKSTTTSFPYDVLSQFIPKYYGTCELTRRRGSSSSSSSGECITHEYVILQDILEGLAQPCVIDLKIGAVTWSPEASQVKVKHEMSKYVGTKGCLGVSLTGMQYYVRDSSSGIITRVRKPKDELKALDSSSFTDCLREFFNVSLNKHKSLELLESVVGKLSVIERVFSRQSSFKLFGSSVLVAYDWGWFEGRDCEAGSPPPPPVRLFMIDFAHFHECGSSELDENYLFGVRSLVRVLSGLVGECKGS